MGRVHALRFAAEGASVGCLDVDAASANAVAAEVRAGGGVAHVAVADVADADGMEQAAQALDEALGPPHVVVANAGVTPRAVASVEDTDPEDWQRVLRINLRGAFVTAGVSIDRLRRRNGALVLVSSSAGLCGFAGYASYVAAKHGVIGLMRSLANELGESVRVNALCPGTTDTPILDGEAVAAGLPRDELVRNQARAHLIPRLITPDEISDAVLWLCSDEAAMVTGVALPVDGGFLANRTLI